MKLPRRRSMKNMWGLRPPHPQVNKPSYRGPAAPGPPAICPSNPQNPQTRFQCHSIANLYLNDKTITGTQYYIITFH